jgi:hypothetical protein
MSEVDVTAIFKGITADAFRLEVRQRYNMPYEDQLIRDFVAGRPLPEDSEEIIRYQAMLRALRATGKRPYRVHVLEFPLTPYLRYELDSYRWSVEAGEEILIADRVQFPDIAELTEDFMFFDGDTDHASVVWYRYNDNDELLSRDYSTDPADIELCRRHRDLAVAHAVPYEEFVRGVSLS